MCTTTEIAVTELKRNCLEALHRARKLRKMAAGQRTREGAELFTEQARFEITKARGYLNQARALERRLEEHRGAA